MPVWQAEKKREAITEPDRTRSLNGPLQARLQVSIQVKIIESELHEDPWCVPHNSMNVVKYFRLAAPHKD